MSVCDADMDLHELSDEDSNDIFVTEFIYPNTSPRCETRSSITAGTSNGEVAETVTEMDVEGTEGSTSQTVATESSTDASSNKGKKETLKRGKCLKN